MGIDAYTPHAASAAESEAPMPATHNLTFAPKLATEAGALDGHGVKCSCGFTAATSLSEREARKLGYAHVEWAKANGR